MWSIHRFSPQFVKGWPVYPRFSLLLQILLMKSTSFAGKLYNSQSLTVGFTNAFDGWIPSHPSCWCLNQYFESKVQQFWPKFGQLGLLGKSILIVKSQYSYWDQYCHWDYWEKLPPFGRFAIHAIQAMSLSLLVLLLHEAPRFHVHELGHGASWSWRESRSQWLGYSWKSMKHGGFTGKIICKWENPSVTRG